MKRCRGKTLLLLAALLSLAWVVPAAALDSSVRIVRLSFISGDVQLDRGQGQGLANAILNTPIVQGSRLWTRGEDALAEVEFEDGSSLRLTPGTAVDFQELSLRGSGEKVTGIELQNGTAYFDVRNHMGDFRVTAGAQQISVSHPARFRVFKDNGEVKVADYKGNLELRSGDHDLAVRSGETFSLDLSEPDHYNLAKGVAEGSYDDWNQQRENYTQSYSAASTYSSDSYYSAYSPAYSYGLADLAYYGNYFYAPGWGWMWRPYYAGAAWNPFMDGAWMWYPQFGYMWVSPYPWGWMPYRYGYWNFVPGYGWCWFPATTWTRWVSVPTVRRPPVGWAQLHPPAAAPKAGTPDVVTVGHAWGTVYPPGGARPLPGNSLMGTKSGAVSNTPAAPPFSTPRIPKIIKSEPVEPPAPPAKVQHDPVAPHPQPAPSRPVAPPIAPARVAPPPAPSSPVAPAPAPAKSAAPPTGPKSQSSAPPTGSHSWGGEHAHGFSGGEHSGGGGWGGGHGGEHH